MMIFGDSGGAVVNSHRELVGINSRIYTGGASGQMADISAAVSTDTVREFIDAYRHRVESQ